jgi:pSer/pThr/pTyr-binding forkhead associated (FHA) protein
MGMLCEECRDDLTSPLRISPEQVQSHFRQPTKAALIDHWGRPHRLDVRTTIGRHLDAVDPSDGRLLLLDASISRNQAQLRQVQPGLWTIEDLNSSNGSFLNDKPVSGVVPLATGNRLVFGDIGFYFVAELGEELPGSMDPLAATTIRSQDRLRLVDMAPPPSNDFAEAERTDAGLPQLDVRLSEPTGGGGGLVEVDARQVQLTTTQYEFVLVLIRRMRDESHQPDLVRGFVRSSELIADLSWDTRDPTENHVKQLVRRVRRALVKAEIGDLIESRHRFGYRLRFVPLLVPHPGAGAG